MSDILASIRKIMAQDPASGGPAIAKPPVNGTAVGARTDARTPAPDAPRDQAPREQAKSTPSAPAPSTEPVTEPTPAAKPMTAATGPAMAPTRQPAPLAPEEAVSLDEFLALAAPLKSPAAPSSPAKAESKDDPITVPVMPVARATPSPPVATAPAPSAGGAPDWLFPRPQQPMSADAKGDVAREPSFGTAPGVGSAGPTHGPGPHLSPATAGGTTAPASPAPPKDAGGTVAPSSRAAPPPPKMLGDLGSVVPGRIDGPSGRPVDPPASGSDRLPPANAPGLGPVPAAPQRVEPARAAAPAPASEPEIPGADALRRLIAGVVPPSSLAPSAPKPNSDDIPTQVVVPPQARTSVPPPAAPAAKPMESAPAAKPIESESAAKPVEPTPAAKRPEAAPAAPATSATSPAASSTPSTKIEVPMDAQTVPVAAPVPAGNAAAPLPAAALSSSRSMDETVVELLRPLLRDWLDTNMPRLIEPALKAELEAMRGVITKDKKN